MKLLVLGFFLTLGLQLSQGRQIYVCMFRAIMINFTLSLQLKVSPSALE
jgi:hypothetical protein